MEYIVRSRAWRDIEGIMIYLRDKGGAEVALRFWEEAQTTFNILTQQPYLGRPRPDLNPHGLRSWRVNGFENWLVFYKINNDEVEIVRVRHGMMDLPKIFEGE